MKWLLNEFASWRSPAPERAVPGAWALFLYGGTQRMRFLTVRVWEDKGSATRDYHMKAVVVAEKSKVACGTVKSMSDWAKRGCSGFPPARQFPVGTGPKPTDADRDRIIKWIDSGTP